MPVSNRIDRVVITGASSGGGSIINIGATLVQQAMTGLPVSAAMASKGGVHALTVSLAAELARHGIRVNTLTPGIIQTPRLSIRWAGSARCVTPPMQPSGARAWRVQTPTTRAEE
jgi:NAD(P)-dependent dehydrogenase (short-subunit alcohol dehydrogenase family)